MLIRHSNRVRRNGPAVFASIGCVAAAVMLFGGAAVAQAGPGHPTRSPYYDFGVLDVPNVVDRNGCIRWCEQDLYPCDPPLYKRVDGRCSTEH